jgi:hypothetical protein
MNPMNDAQLVGELLETAVSTEDAIFSKQEWLVIPELNNSNSGAGFNTSQFTFELQQQASSWTVPSRAFIRAQVTVKDSESPYAELPATANSKPIYYNLKQPQSWVQRAILKFNGGVVEDRQEPAVFDFIDSSLTASQDWESTIGAEYGYALDTKESYADPFQTDPPARPGTITTALPLGEPADVGAWARSKAQFNGNKGTLILPLGRLFETVKMMQFPVTQLPISIELYTETQRCLGYAANLTAAQVETAFGGAGHKPRLYIDKLELFLPKVQFTEEYALKTTKYIQSQPVKSLKMTVPRFYGNFATVNTANAVKDWDVIVSPSSINPTALYLIFPRESDYTDVTGTKSPYYLGPHCDISSVNVLINDQYIYSRPLQTDLDKGDYHELYQKFLEFTNASGSNLMGGCLISYRRFRDEFRIVTIDLTNVPNGALVKGVAANVRVSFRVKSNVNIKPLAVLLEEKELKLQWASGGVMVNA